MKRCKGISLVEVMVLIIAFAILSLVFLPHFRGASRRSREAAMKSNMFTLKVAAEDFATMAYGLYPEDPTYSVAEVLSDYGIASSNQMRIADNCPATGFDVNTGSGFALLPGDTTYVNPFLYNGNCLDKTELLPPHAPISPYSNGQGTVYWVPDYSLYMYSTDGYVIYADGFRCLYWFSIRSEY